MDTALADHPEHTADERVAARVLAVGNHGTAAAEPERFHELLSVDTLRDDDFDLGFGIEEVE